jgi:hypothetical protein
MHQDNEQLREIYHTTEILRKPISGIVSGYHELPYILVAPGDDDPAHTIEINGKINVSPKFIISPGMLAESFGEVFDPETFDSDIEGRLFSFGYASRKNLKVKSEYFRIQKYDENPQSHIDRVQDNLMSQENTRTGLIFGPKYKFYPVSLDRFISEIVDREFRV